MQECCLTHNRCGTRVSRPCLCQRAKRGQSAVDSDAAKKVTRPVTQSWVSMR
jgi:hypothetical protein